MVFCSDRENRTNLFRYDLDTGAITQMTDLDGRKRLIGCVSERNHALYFWTDTVLLEVDLDTFRERVIAEVDPAMPPSAIKSRAHPTADGKGDHLFGYVRWDNRDHVEVDFPFHSSHFHSLDESMMVGDGTPAMRTPAQPYIQLFRRVGEGYVGPKVLAYHRSTFNDQHAHCHPRITPDGKAVLYTSDLTGYSNMYLAEIGDFEELPGLADL